MEQKPLFIPLRSDYFHAFADGKKTIEWRRLTGRFSLPHLRNGRRVTLSNGYSGARLHATIVGVECRRARDVGPEVVALYEANTMLVGIHLQLDQAKARRASAGSLGGPT